MNRWCTRHLGVCVAWSFVLLLLLFASNHSFMNFTQSFVEFVFFTAASALIVLLADQLSCAFPVEITPPLRINYRTDISSLVNLCLVWVVNLVSFLLLSTISRFSSSPVRWRSRINPNFFRLTRCSKSNRVIFCSVKFLFLCPLITLRVFSLE